MSSDYVYHDGFMFKDSHICVLDCTLRLQMIKELHTEGHVGRDKTLHLVSTTYFSPTLRRDLERFVDHCFTCQQVKGKASNAGLYMPLPIPTQPWTDVSINFVGHKSRYKHDIPSSNGWSNRDHQSALGDLMYCLVGDHIQGFPNCVKPSSHINTP